MSFSTQNPFDDVEDNKMRVTFSIRIYDKEVRVNHTYDDDTTWGEVLSDIVSALEASYGFSFNIPHPNNPDINMGIYVKDRNDD